MFFIIGQPYGQPPPGYANYGGAPGAPPGMGPPPGMAGTNRNPNSYSSALRFPRIQSQDS